MTQNELYRNGILGMKWGVRRTPEQLGHRMNRSEKKAAKEQGDIAIKDVYADSDAKASAQRQADYKQATEDYALSRSAARTTYKDAVMAIKRG